MTFNIRQLDNLDYDEAESLSAMELYRAFGVAQSTGQAKSKQVRDLLNMSHFDPQWALPSTLENNPSVMIRQLINIMLDNN